MKIAMSIILGLISFNALAQNTFTSKDWDLFRCVKEKCKLGIFDSDKSCSASDFNPCEPSFKKHQCENISVGGKSKILALCCPED